MFVAAIRREGVIHKLHLMTGRMMQLFYPRSFLTLLAIGFALVALPMVFALINNAISIDQLANRSQQAVYRAAQTTQGSRQLGELLTAMERNARQMVILQDRALLDSYVLNRKRFQDTASEFAALAAGSEQKQALDAIVRGEAEIFAVITDSTASLAQHAKAVEGFSELAQHSRVITARSNDLIDREVEAMRTIAAQAQRITLWQLLALIPVVVFLVVGFIILIVRPIRHIDAAIRRLGSGDFNTAVDVAGPQDLQQLGSRLEWMRHRLTDLEQEKNLFLRQVSHEFKTPLTALREGAELLSDEVVGKLSPEQREVVEIIRHNSLELQKLIEDLLSYGASQFHKTAMMLEPVAVRNVIRRVVGDQKLALRAKNLRLQVHAQDVTVAADFDKLRVMLDNLVSNAVKVSPLGGHVEIQARALDGRLELDVADEGPGIAVVDREHIFKPFYRGVRAEHSLVKSTGIGLSVVKEYAAAHGGSVEVVDTEKQRGARMRVRLPLTNADAMQ